MTTSLRHPLTTRLAARRPAAVAGLATSAVIAAALAVGVATPAGAAPAAAAAVGTPKIAGSYGSGGASLRPGDSLVSDGQNSYLFSAGLPGRSLTRGDDVLIVQSDGNVVEYERTSSTTRRAVWSTGTAGIATPTRLTFQQDGNVVLYDRGGVARWSTGTAGRPAQYFGVYGNGQVVTQDGSGRVLSAVGPAVTALPGFTVSYANSVGTGGDHVLRVQDDGNVVAYRYDFAAGTSRAYWSTGTAGAGAVRFVAQADGNLVLYQRSSGRAVWQSHTSGPRGYYQFDVQADGNVVLYRTDGVRRLAAVWASGTRA